MAWLLDKGLRDRFSQAPGSLVCDLPCWRNRKLPYSVGSFMIRRVKGGL